uniref:NADH-ubiquinone oxidoreductase chain 3 n=1 Tax=Philotrypesis sp. JHX-2011 TaxID=1035792 RepID=G8EEJ5_9HYME|nr:NADH dehydrogenase subunit 3 [Philotrypesis sp. JHX-2011]
MIYMLFFIILIIMLMINMIISKKLFKNREKSSPFECGFDPMSKNRLPFSMSFYLISIIFLIFDIEIAMILPLTFTKLNLFYLFSMNLLMILFILIIGLLIEWKEGALKWIK